MGDMVTEISGEITGGNKVARAAGEAAQAQERAMVEGVGFAQQGLAAGQAAGQQAIAAANSPQELAALTQALNRQGSAIDKQASKLSHSCRGKMLSHSLHSKLADSVRDRSFSTDFGSS